MDLRHLGTKAKELFDRRGGTKSAKEDAAELKDTATGPGSMSDKARRAAEAVKEPGAAKPAAPEPGAQEPPPRDAPPAG